jgi:hypothetical protein
MNSTGIPAISLNTASDLIDFTFCLNKHDGFVLLFGSNFGQKLQKPSKQESMLKIDDFQAIANTLSLFFKFLANVDDLENVVVGSQLQRSNIDLDVVLQKLLGQDSYFFGPGCGPHQSLSVRL